MVQYIGLSWLHHFSDAFCSWQYITDFMFSTIVCLLYPHNDKRTTSVSASVSTTASVTTAIAATTSASRVSAPTRSSCPLHSMWVLQWTDSQRWDSWSCSWLLRGVIRYEARVSHRGFADNPPVHHYTPLWGWNADNTTSTGDSYVVFPSFKLVIAFIHLIDTPVTWGITLFFQH